MRRDSRKSDIADEELKERPVRFRPPLQPACRHGEVHNPVD
jgi:hypothetical protein